MRRQSWTNSWKPDRTILDQIMKNSHQLVNARWGTKGRMETIELVALLIFRHPNTRCDKGCKRSIQSDRSWVKFGNKQLLALLGKLWLANCKLHTYLIFQNHGHRIRDQDWCRWFCLVHDYNHHHQQQQHHHHHHHQAAATTVKYTRDS